MWAPTESLTGRQPLDTTERWRQAGGPSSAGSRESQGAFTTPGSPLPSTPELTPLPTQLGHLYLLPVADGQLPEVKSLQPQPWPQVRGLGVLLGIDDHFQLLWRHE